MTPVEEEDFEEEISPVEEAEQDFSTEMPEAPSPAELAQQVREIPAHLKALEPEKIKKGMQMEFDGGSLAYVEDSFAALDEFWLSDAKTREVIHRDGGIRAFTSSELLWTGEYSEDAEIQESLAVPGVILETLIEDIKGSGTGGRSDPHS